VFGTVHTGANNLSTAQTDLVTVPYAGSSIQQETCGISQRAAHCHRISADTKSVTNLDEEIAFELVSQPLKIILPWSRTLCMVPDEGFCTMPNSKAGFAQLVSPKIPHPTKTVGLIII